MVWPTIVKLVGKISAVPADEESHIAGRKFEPGDRVVGNDKRASFQSGTEKTETYVHSRATFLKDERLSPAVPRTHHVRLRIQATQPHRAEDARALVRDAYSSWTFKWRIVTTVNVVRGRDPKRQRQVSVTFDRGVQGL